MGYASLSGRATTNPTAPRAFAVCDRCGMWYNHDQLRFQHDYRGRSLANIRILVCETCEDEPQPQLKPRIIPPDPLPIINARVEQFCEDEVDDRVTTNPALPPVDWYTSTNIQLAGLQFIDGRQLQDGELILVANQTDRTLNGIYKASTGVWTLMAYNNDRKQYYYAAEIDTTWSGGELRYGQLGYYMGAVYVARGPQKAKLYQIIFDDPAAIIGGAAVTLSNPPASTVNRIDFFTGIYMEGVDFVRVTEDGFVRTPQQVGQASGNTNEIPGYNQIVPGACEIGRPTEVPYGCATYQGLPSSMDVLPYSGALWPTLQNQSINAWISNFSNPFVWVNDFGVEVTFESQGFWANPGPGGPYRPIRYLTEPRQWQNNFQGIDLWYNVANQQLNWYGNMPLVVFPPGGDTLWTNDKCNLVLWHNQSGDNVDFAEIYPNAIKPNKSAPWPWGWGV